MAPDPLKPVPLTTAHIWMLGQLGAVVTCIGGGVMECHFVPFHSTAAGGNGRIPLAMQNARVGQDTPVSSPPGGSASCRQAPCFQSHATAFVGAELLLPTAMHQREGRHDTPASTPRLFVAAVAAAGLEVLAPAGPAAAIAAHPRTAATAASTPIADL